ncbi:MAG: hypothetical protein H6Q00_2304 [Holophagaceae bacterium]|nr:hypothetical protein [Holophagaceae bacterium]
MIKTNKMREIGALGTSLSLLFILAACGGSSSSSNSSSEATTTTISSTKTLSSLTIGENETLVAPDGKSLTLTVDGVEKNLEPGTYTGDVVLDVTDQHEVVYMGGLATHYFRMGLYVEDGAVVADKSVESALVSVDYNGNYATGGSLTSQGDNFNGIVVGGATGTAETPYTVYDMTMNFTGNGSNDFAGYGAALMTTGTSHVLAEKLNITTDGCIRTAVWGGGSSVLTVKDSIIVGNSATAEQVAGVSAPMMKEVPWLLGISGNNRATNVLEGAQVTYKNCSVTAETWGALSTDSCTAGAMLTAEDTSVRFTGTSGYGSYADGAVQNTYTHCSFDVPDMVLIVAAGQCGATFKSNDLGASTATSRRFGIMWHKNQGGTVDLQAGTVFHTGETMFLVKSDVSNTAYPILKVDGATLVSDTNVIYHLMESDDAGMGGGAPGSETMWAASYTVPTVVPVHDTSVDTTVVNADTALATFSNMEVNGDIYNTRWTADQNLKLSFVGAKITGVISAGTQANKFIPAGGLIYPSTRQYLSEETVTPSPVVGNGVIVSLDATTTWAVTGPSYLSSLTITDAEQITSADPTKSVVMLVNDVATPIVTGTFTGKITLFLQ